MYVPWATYITALNRYSWLMVMMRHKLNKIFFRISGWGDTLINKDLKTSSMCPFREVDIQRGEENYLGGTRRPRGVGTSIIKNTLKGLKSVPKVQKMVLSLISWYPLWWE